MLKTHKYNIQASKGSGNLGLVYENVKNTNNLNYRNDIIKTRILIRSTFDTTKVVSLIFDPISNIKKDMISEPWKM